MSTILNTKETFLHATYKSDIFMAIIETQFHINLSETVHSVVYMVQCLTITYTKTDNDCITALVAIAN